MTEAQKWPAWKPRPKEVWPNAELFTLRMYDQYDGWIDIAANLTAERVEERWLEKTAGGTKNTKYEDVTYYDIFPADTRMIYNSEVMDP